MAAPVPFATDQPINKSGEDRFSRKPFSFRVAHTIAHRSDPSSLVVGIYGAWGEGKTSVLRMIDEGLASEKGVRTFWFNPWRYRDEDTLLEQFFRSMAKALGSSISSKAEDLGGLLKRYKKVITPLLIFGGAAAKNFTGVPEPLAGTITATGEQVDNLADALTDVDAETLKERIDDHLSASDTRLVVFMDDLDRLDHQEIQAVFRLVKLTLSFRNTAFVLAFDNEVVEQALASQYGDASRKFLEKIIQVPLQLPRADALILRQFCFAGVEEALQLAEIQLGDKETRRFLQAFDPGILPRLSTPRMARRYANTLSFALPILRYEVNAVDLMLIEAVRIFYPRLYSSIRSNRDLYVWSLTDVMSKDDKDFRNKKKQAILAVIENLTESDREAALHVVKALFPRNTALLSEPNMGYSEEAMDSWSVEKRLTSSDYFDRYFGYAVPANDISDAEFEAFMEGLVERNRDDINSDVRRLCGGGRAERFMEKVRLAVESVQPERSGPLAIAISSNADLFFGPGGNGIVSLREDAAIRVYWLIQRMPTTARFPIALECVKAANPPVFATEIKRWLTVDKTKEEPVLTDSEYESLKTATVSRIKEAVADRPAWEVFGRDTGWVLHEWATLEDKTATSQHLLHWLKSEPQRILPFLESTLTNATEMSTGMPLRRAFSRSNYDELALVVDVEFVAEALYKLGFEPEHGDQFEPPKNSPEEQTARRFLALHAQSVTQAPSPSV